MIYIDGLSVIYFVVEIVKMPPNLRQYSNSQNFILQH